MKYNYDDGINKNNEEIAMIRKAYDERKISEAEAERRINELFKSNIELENAKQEEARTLGGRLRGFFSNFKKKGEKTKVGISVKNFNAYKGCQKMLDEYYDKYKDKDLINLNVGNRTFSNFNHIDITLKALFGNDEKIILSKLSINQQVIYKKIIDKIRHEYKLDYIEKNSIEKENAKTKDGTETISPAHEETKEEKVDLVADKNEKVEIKSDEDLEESNVNGSVDKTSVSTLNNLDKLSIDKLKKYLILLRRSRSRGRLNINDKKFLKKLRQSCGISVSELNSSEIALLEKKRFNGVDSLSQEEKKIIDNIYDKIDNITKNYDSLMEKEKNSNGLLDIKDSIMLIEYEDTLKGVSSLIAKGLTLTELNDEMNSNLKHRKHSYSDNIILNSLKQESERRRKKTNIQTNNLQKGVLQSAIQSLDIEKMSEAIKKQNFQKIFANDNEFIRKINNVVNVLKISPEVIDALSIDEKKRLNEITSMLNITKESINGETVVIEIVKQELRNKFGYENNESNVAENKHRAR